MARQTRGSFFSPSSDSSSDELHTAGPLEVEEEGGPDPGPAPSVEPPQAKPAPSASARGRSKRRKRRKGPGSQDGAPRSPSAAEDEHGPAPSGEKEAEPTPAIVVASVTEGAGQALWLAAKTGDVAEVKRNLNEAALKWTMSEDASIALEYKGWKVESQALHAAVFSKDPDPDDTSRKKRKEVVRLLLESQADPMAKASDTWVDKDQARHKWELPVIHMAAGCGHGEVIRLLLEYRADVNEMSRLNDFSDTESDWKGKDLVAPIHDAVLFNRADCVKVLLDGGTMFDMNKELCLAAKLGHDSVVEVLCKHHRNGGYGKARPNGSQTFSALLQAVKGRRFPLDRLYLFRESFTNDWAYLKAFPLIAQENENAAFALLRDIEEENPSAQKLDPELRSMMQSYATGAKEGEVVDILLKLLRKAPKAASVMLDVLTSEPKVKHPERNPLPRFMSLSLSDDIYPLACKYECDVDWEWDKDSAANWDGDNQCENHAGDQGGDDGMKKWQRRLMVKNASWLQEQLRTLFDLGKCQLEVSIRVVRVKGLASPAVLNCLAQTQSTDDHLFGKLVVHALLKYVWKALRSFFLADMIFDALATLVMTRWIFSGLELSLTSAFRSQFASRAAWCVVASQGTCDAVVLFWTAVNHCRTLGIADMLVWLCQKWHRVSLSFLTIWLAAATQEDHWPDETDLTSILLGSASFSHWWTFLYKARAFTVTGRKLLPIIKSFQHVGSVFVIIIVLLISFLNFFWALDRQNADEVLSWEVLTFLLAGDNFLDRDFPSDEKDLGRRVLLMWLGGFGLFVFTACCLNLFIAVLGEMYEHEQERIAYTFLKERAGTCSFLSLRPELPLPPGWPTWARPTRTLVVLCSIAACAASVSLALYVCMLLETSSWPATLLGVSWAILHQAVMKSELTKAWTGKYLWFCANTDGAEEMLRLGHRDRLFPQSRPWKLKEYVAEITAKLQEQGEQLKLQGTRQLHRQRRAERHLRALAQAAQLRKRRSVRGTIGGRGCE